MVVNQIYSTVAMGMVLEVVNELNKIINSNLKTSIGPRRLGDSQLIVSNVEKFMKYFSWKPKHNSLNYILKTAISWEKKLNGK